MMKKFAAAVVLGAIVGAVAYKLKKEYEDKKALDEELDMLSGNEECTCDEECTCECEKDLIMLKNQIDSIYASDLETSVKNEQIKLIKAEMDVLMREYDLVDKEVQEKVDENKEIVYEVIEDAEEVVEEVKEAVEEKVEEVKEAIEEKIEENEAVEETVEKKTAFLEESFQENPLTANLDDDYKRMLDAHSDSIIDQLSTNKDELDEERPIQHFIDFKSVEDMEAFKAVVIEKGYVVTRGESPYQLTVLHIAPINRSELLVNVYYLANQAIKHNAKYLGWQSRKVL